MIENPATELGKLKESTNQLLLDNPNDLGFSSSWEILKDERRSLQPEDDWRIENRLATLAVYLYKVRRHGLERVLRINNLETTLLSLLYLVDNNLEDLANDFAAPAG